MLTRLLKISSEGSTSLTSLSPPVDEWLGQPSVRHQQGLLEILELMEGMGNERWKKERNNRINIGMRINSNFRSYLDCLVASKLYCESSTQQHSNPGEWFEVLYSDLLCSGERKISHTWRQRWLGILVHQSRRKREKCPNILTRSG